MESRLSIDEAMVMVSKQLRTLDAGKARLHYAREINNLVGKLLKGEALELAKAAFLQSGGKLLEKK